MTILDDTMAVAVLRAVAKHNCRALAQESADRIGHFVRRIDELGRSPKDVIIVLVHVDDPVGRHFAEALMPGADWQQFRDQGQVPIARGLAAREPFEAIVSDLDDAAGARLKDILVPVVVVDHGVVAVFDALMPLEGQVSP